MRMRIKAKTIILILVVSQLFMSSCKTYRNLDKASANPEDVTVLKIKNKNIQKLSPEISKLKNLKTLYLFRDKLTSIPKEIGKLENLETLILSSNKLESLPKEIGNLKKLKKISLKHNNQNLYPLR